MLKSLTHKLLIVVANTAQLPLLAQFEHEVRKSSFNLQLIWVYAGYPDEADFNRHLEQLQLRKPDEFLKVHKETSAIKMARMIQELNTVLTRWQPELVIAPGHATATVAAAITARQLRIPFAHLESGLRSFEPDETDENNRQMADTLADHLWVSEPSGEVNLTKENKSYGKLLYAGNTRIDTLVAFRETIAQAKVLHRLKLEPGQFAVLSLTASRSIDLEALLPVLNKVVRHLPIVCLMDAGLRQQLIKKGIPGRLVLPDRLHWWTTDDFLNSQKLLSTCKLVMTNRSDHQESSTYWRTACLTLRPITDRPVTVRRGTNTLVGLNLNLVENNLQAILNGKYKRGSMPKMWDGKATRRLLRSLAAPELGASSTLNLMSRSDTTAVLRSVATLRVEH